MKHDVDQLSQELNSTSRSESIEKSCCSRCDTPCPNESFRDEIAKHEYTLSGFCQPCQDAFYEEGEEWS